MRSIVLATLFSAIVVSCFAMSAKAEGTYRDAVKQCGQEWRASDARKSVEKGKGREAWQSFRVECVKRVGYTRKGK